MKTKIKKSVWLLPLLAMLLVLNSCDKEGSAVVKVKVTTATLIPLPRSGVTVHMFGSRKGPSTLFFMPFHSDKDVVTESDGVATFELRKTDLNGQTTFYFGVFQGSNTSRNYLGMASVTIKKGETKEISIMY